MVKKNGFNGVIVMEFNGIILMEFNGIAVWKSMG
jgi:hypothetical protein